MKDFELIKYEFFDWIADNWAIIIGALVALGVVLLIWSGRW